MKTFKVGDKVKILSYNNWETVIESINDNKYWSKDDNGELSSCKAEEMELISEYNKTFNPEAHSSLIIDFDKHESLLIEAIENNKAETIEEASRNYRNAFEGVQDSAETIAQDSFKKGAKSDAAKNHWFKIFQEEQRGQDKHPKN